MNIIFPRLEHVRTILFRGSTAARTIRGCIQIKGEDYYFSLAPASMSVIDDDDEPDRILENTNLDEFELIDSPREQLDDSSQENMGVGSAPTMDTDSTSGLAPRTGGDVELRLGVDPCQGSSLSSPLYNSRGACAVFSRACTTAVTREISPPIFRGHGLIEGTK